MAPSPRQQTKGQVALLTLRKDQPAWDPSSLECGPVPIAGSAERLARETEFYHTIER